MNNFENETPEGYVTIEQAAQTETVEGQFWELHPDVNVHGEHYDDAGYIMYELELTDQSALADIEQFTEGGYVVYGNNEGDPFTSVFAYANDWTPVRLVDER